MNQMIKSNKSNKRLMFIYRDRQRNKVIFSRFATKFVLKYDRTSRRLPIDNKTVADS